jgi:hypothetical protein
MRPIVPAVCLSLTCAAFAQSPTVTLPPAAQTADLAWSWVGPLDTTDFRYQQAWPFASVSRGDATFHRVEFRSDAGAQHAGSTLAGTMLNNVTVTLGETDMVQLSTTFDDNTSYRPQTVVFTGSIQLPARSPVPQGTPAPWFGIPLAQPHTERNTGRSILLEIRGLGSVPGGAGGAPFPFDAEHTTRSHGSVRSVGRSGDTTLEPWIQNPMPGSQISMSACGGAKFYMVGLGVLPQPIDLGIVGAPGEHLHVLPELVLPGTIQNTAGRGCTPFTVFAVTVPKGPQFASLRLAFQTVRASGMPAPAPSVVTSNALEFLTGYLPAYDSSIVYGTQRASVGNTSRGEAPVVRFVGTFY